MKITAEWSREDVGCIKALWSKHRRTEYQKAVRQRNLAVPWHRPPDDEVWDLHVRCILTSQQPSGPDGVHARAFDGVDYGASDLSIRRLAQARDPESHARAFLRTNGFRMCERRGRWISDNFSTFVTDGKCRIIDECASELAERRSTAAKLGREALVKLEREAVEQLAWGQHKVSGMGPKQAGHFLKQVGLSVYTMPVDSRLMAFLWDLLDAPDEAGPWTGSLSDEYTVRMVENWFGALAERAGITPVELDTLVWEAYGK